ncbi:MAG: hypothetical protein P1U34_03955 [Coxiellaceae bacterium]|nr:hypothetical protein [Coxiellaceae bacterium]
MRDEVLSRLETNIGYLARDPKHAREGLQTFEESELLSFGVVQNGIACLGYIESQAKRLQGCVKRNYPHGLSCDESTIKFVAGIAASLLVGVFIGFLLKLTVDMPHDFFDDKNGRSKTLALFGCGASTIVDLAALIICSIKLKNRYQQNTRSYFENRYQTGSQAVGINRLLMLCKPFTLLASIGQLDQYASGHAQLVCLGKIISTTANLRRSYRRVMISKDRKTTASSSLLLNSTAIDLKAINRNIMEFLRGIAKPVLQSAAPPAAPTAPHWSANV